VGPSGGRCSAAEVLPALGGGGMSEEGGGGGPAALPVPSRPSPPEPAAFWLPLVEELRGGGGVLTERVWDVPACLYTVWSVTILILPLLNQERKKKPQ
jgi:hypothetical protein